MASKGITVKRLTTPPSTLQWTSNLPNINENNSEHSDFGSQSFKEGSYIDKDTDTITYDSYSPTSEFPQGSFSESWEEDLNSLPIQEQKISIEHYTDDFESETLKTKSFKDTEPRSETVKYSDDFETEADSKTVNIYSNDFDTQLGSKTTQIYSDDFESDQSKNNSDYHENFTPEACKLRRIQKGGNVGNISELSPEADSYRSDTYAETYESAVYPQKSYFTAEDYKSDYEETEQYSSDFEDVEDSQIQAERHERIAKETEIALKEFTSAMISRIRQKRFDETDLTQLESIQEQVTDDKPRQERNYQQERYIKKKLKFLRQKPPDKNKNEILGEPKETPIKFQSITEYGLNPQIIEKLKLNNTLNRMRKIAKEEIHDPRKCKECRKLKLKIDEEEAKRNFIREKSRHVAQKIIEDRVQRHLLHMHSVNLIGNIARDLPSHNLNPEVVTDLLNKGLSTTHWRIVPE